MLQRILVMALTAILLNGCTTLPPQAPPSSLSWQDRKQSLSQITFWRISGKLAARTRENSGSATIDWEQKNQAYTISLFGPLGSNNLLIRGKPGEVVLMTADGQRFQGNSAETLLAQNWGFKLPVTALYYWVRSLPAPQQPFKYTFDPSHRVRTLSQNGWEIGYLRYTRLGNTDLPTLIRITSPQLTAKLAITRWKL